MFASMLRVEHKKLYRRPLVWVELGLVAAVVLFAFVVFFGARALGVLENQAMDAMLTWPQSLPFSLQFVTGQTFGALLLALLVSLAVTQEYTWGTYALWLRQGASRSAVLGAKALAMVGPAVLIALTALVVGAIASAVGTIVMRGSLDFSLVDWVQVGLSIVRTVYSLLPYMGLALLVAVATRSTAWSLGVVVGYALLVEGLLTQIALIIGGVPAKLAMWMPGSMALAVVKVNDTVAAASTTAVTGGPEMLPAGVAAVGIAVYTLVFVGAAFRIFARQDITA